MQLQAYIWSKKSILLVFLLFTIRGKAQDQDSGIVRPLHSFSLNSDTEWLENIFGSRIADDVKIIGLGEVLHGGREISECKAKIVQYLIQKKGVRIFLFEYPNAALCMLNYYLRENDLQSNDTLKMLAINALSGSLYDKSFLDLLYWIKQFNVKHSNDMVSLKGVDMTGASGSFSNYFMLNFSSLLDSNTKKEIDSEWNRTSIDVITQQLIGWCDKNKDIIEIRLKKFYPELLYNIRQAESGIFYSDLQRINEGKAYVFRDSLMAVYVSAQSTGRSVVWAHNLHITPSNYYAAGFYLKKKLMEHYYVIVTDFTGSAKIRVLKDSGLVEKNFTAHKYTIGRILSKRLISNQGIIFYNDIIKEKRTILFGSIDIHGGYQLLGAGKGFDALVLLSDITPNQFE